MSDILCGYTGDREAALMSYLYDEMAPGERTAFDRHLAACARCRVELNGLGDVRQQLARWSPPDFASTRVAVALDDVSTADERRPAAAGSRHWWHEIPVWAQVAAAMLFLGASAGIANLDIRYDTNGLTVRTGWSKPVPAAQTASARGTATADAPWRPELTALERQLRSELQGRLSAPATRNAGGSETEIFRRVKTLLDESERRQQRELALRVAEVVRDVNVRREADLRKIDQNLGLMLDRTGVEVMKNRQMIDYLQRVSQRQ